MMNRKMRSIFASFVGFAVPSPRPCTIPRAPGFLPRNGAYHTQRTDSYFHPTAVLFAFYSGPTRVLLQSYWRRASGNGPEIRKKGRKRGRSDDARTSKKRPGGL